MRRLGWDYFWTAVAIAMFVSAVLLWADYVADVVAVMRFR